MYEAREGLQGFKMYVYMYQGHHVHVYPKACVVLLAIT